MVSLAAKSLQLSMWSARATAFQLQQWTSHERSTRRRAKTIPGSSTARTTTKTTVLPWKSSNIKRMVFPSLLQHSVSFTSPMLFHKGSNHQPPVFSSVLQHHTSRLPSCLRPALLPVKLRKTLK
ncbi:uncharacterized protein LOC119167949 isoform X3 [Rhipicephalus microplus]|uniref:uncharacterized protein LOC119167949 isoform X3 n=1 Tax=Rhipicephalus microplus TaxID=6941 RepID=UPI003F6AEBC9